MEIQIYNINNDDSRFYTSSHWKSKPGPIIPQSLLYEIQNSWKLGELYKLAKSNITLDSTQEDCYSLGFYSWDNIEKRDGKSEIRFKINRSINNIILYYQVVSDDMLIHCNLLYETKISKLGIDVSHQFDVFSMSSVCRGCNVNDDSREKYFRTIWMMLKYKYLI